MTTKRCETCGHELVSGEFEDGHTEWLVPLVPEVIGAVHACGDALYVVPMSLRTDQPVFLRHETVCVVPQPLAS